MGEQAGEKTEEPTPHRLREAREKGQVAKSKEITTAILLLVSFSFFRYMGPFMLSNIINTVSTILQQIPHAQEFSLGFAGFILLIALRGLAFTVLPLFACVFLASVIAEALQTGLVFAADPLSPKIERINPLEGFKKMFGIQGFVETIKSVLKIVIVFYISWSTVKGEIPSIVVLINSSPWDALALGGEIAFKIAMRIGTFYILIAFLDYLFRRWEYMRNLKMTRQEVKEEYKRLEGDPLVKQRMRDMQRQVAYQRMMAAVPQSDVVVTNPTHLACALKYEATKSKAPILLAKGERLIAQEIKRIAEEHEIPIMENEPLARSIFRTTKIKKEVPPELYQAIAEVLAYVYKVKKDRKERNKRIPVMPIG